VIITFCPSSSVKRLFFGVEVVGVIGGGSEQCTMHKTARTRRNGGQWFAEV
jgi:hypothetical protein